MSVELLQTCSVVAYVLAGVFLLITVALFFLLDIPGLYGDLSGRTAKKAIEAIRKQNEASQTKKTSGTSDPKTPTDRITASGRITASTADLPPTATTAKISTARLQATPAIRATGGVETTLLTETPQETPQYAQTTLLCEEPRPYAETALLTEEPAYAPHADAPYGQTVVLGAPEAFATSPIATSVTLEMELSFLGSTEIIE